MRRRVIRLVVSTTCALWFVAGCTDQLPVSPTLPPAAPFGPTAPTETSTLRGTVWVHGAGGAAPATSGSVYGWVERPTSGYSTGRVPIQVDGRYEFQIPADATRVFVQGPRFQPCSTMVIPGTAINADVHVVSDPGMLNGNLPESLRSHLPTLTGTVYELTTSGPRPLANAWVTLDSLGGLGNLIADTLSGPDGRYLLCGVPSVPRLTVVAGLTGYEIYYSTGSLGGSASLDIEMRRSAN